MALSKREKVLAVVIGILLVPAAGLVLAGGFGGSLKALRATQQNVDKEVQDKKSQVEDSQEAKKRLVEWNRRALPSDPQIATSLYQNWLLKLSEGVGFRGRKVEPNEGRPQPGIYHRLSFTVRGQATLDQLVDWLSKFYSKGHLHKIRTLSIKPLEGSETLDLVITIEALSLPGATDAEGAERKDVLSQEPSKWLAGSDLVAYRESIVRRNVFAPYKPTPPKPEYRAEPEPARFEHSKYTFVTAIVEVDGKPQVWIEVRTLGKKFKLSEGDSFELGPVQATILRIEQRTVESEMDGKRYVLALGDNLTEAVELSD